MTFPGTNLGAPLSLGLASGKGTKHGAVKGGVTSPIYVYESTPFAQSTNSIALAQAVSGAGNLTLAGALVTSGVAALDIPRCVSITSANASDTSQTATFTGTDTYGIALVETVSLLGTSTISGLKAFNTVSKVAMSASTAGNITAGIGSKFGLPYYISVKGSCQAFWDATWNNTSGTTTVGDTTSPGTATTGDVRGTYLPATAADGVRTLALWIYMNDVDTNNGLYGVDQYGG